MKDQYKRNIDYLRISLTDRCNLHCRYCQPEVACHVPHEQILRYEELLRICRAAVRLGISKFKITGGEPLVRKGCADFIRKLKRLEGVAQVTLTTNGTLLPQLLPELAASGLDSMNISLDTTDAQQYRELTGGDIKTVSAGDRAGAEHGQLPCKCELLDRMERLYSNGSNRGGECAGAYSAGVPLLLLSLPELWRA